jgi:hypothetical protein
MLPRLVAERGFDDADDVAAVLHHRAANVTAVLSTTAGRGGPVPRYIAGLIPHASGPMPHDLRHALTERAELIEQRATALAETDVADGAAWTRDLGDPPADPRRRATWMRQVRVVAAYRDRYQIGSDEPLGAPPEASAQQDDAERAHTAARRARRLKRISEPPRVAPARAQSRRTGGPAL